MLNSTLSAPSPTPDARTSDQIRYQAIRSRDARFDGLFFTAVTSTRIYCRPSCPATTPKLQHVRFYLTAAEAEAAGFRACKRCRPEAAPGSPAWNFRAELTGRAMSLINDGVVDREGVAGLAHHLGYSTRQLHRHLTEELGVGPLALARTRRVHMARLLLSSTSLSVTQVAMASGFSSLRQFNDTLHTVLGMAPRELRRQQSPDTDEGPQGLTRIAVRLPYRPPFAGPALFRFLKTRVVPGVEGCTDSVYRRVLGLPHGIGIAQVTLPPEPARPDSPHLLLEVWLRDIRDLAPAVHRMRRLFDLDTDPEAVYTVLADDSAIGRWVRAQPGLRAPGHVDPHELAFRAVIGQQISVTAANTVAGQIVQRFGEALETPWGTLTHAFPTAEVLAAQDPSAFPMPRRRQLTLSWLAKALAEQSIRLDLAHESDKTAAQLASIPGIGPWTVSYIRMRALSDPDVFLPTDLGVRHALDALHLESAPRAAAERAEGWRPWRSYALQYLWNGLTPESGIRDAASP